MLPIEGVAQHYSWGDRAAIPQLLGVEPDGRPWAELWFGTHPGGPATVAGGTPLRDAVGDLPYLVKLLAAAEPLSLQTHPSSAQARAGFAREEAAGLARDDPRRIYRDTGAKPELICALGPFEALCGLRDPAQTHAWFVAQGWHGLAELLGDGDLAGYVRATLSSPDVALPDDLPAWARHLAQLHPHDRGGVAAALALHHVSLQPGEALLLDAGTLHMYLSGVGVEVMAASDNVVRAAFTSKHVDVDELLAVLDARPVPDPVVRPTETSPGVWVYPTISTAFELSRCDVAGTIALPPADGPELLLCTDGSASDLRPGQAVIVPAGERAVLSGSATVWRCRAAPAAG